MISHTDLSIGARDRSEILSLLTSSNEDTANHRHASCAREIDTFLQLPSRLFVLSLDWNAFKASNW